MKPFLGFVLFVAFSVASISGQESLVDADIHRLDRHLLQDGENMVHDGEASEKEANKKEQEKPAPIGIAAVGVPKLGPKLFYDGEYFLMRLGAPIRVTIFPGDNADKQKEKLSVVDLDGPAISIKGSMIKDGEFKVNMDWKSQSFGNNFKITSIQVHLYFMKKNGEFFLDKLEVAGLTINGKQMHSNPLKVQTEHGYKVGAPLGASFGCYDPGMFEPVRNDGNQVKNDYRVGLTFPKMELQVFELSKGQKPLKFGPEWVCDSMITIGLLVGLLVTLIFTSIVTWGICMLANVHTCDRFDDPRGKQIYVPLTD